MTFRASFLALLLAALAGSTPAQDSDDPGAAIAKALDEDRIDDAEKLFAALEKQPAGVDATQLEGLRGRLRKGRTVRAVRTAFDAGRPAAQSRVREAAESAGADSKENAARDSRFEHALQELSARSPLRVPLTSAVTLENVRVTSYANGQVVLTWPQGSVEYPLMQLPEETRTALVAGALTKGTPRDHFEMGKLLILAKDYERSARCFATAVQKDPALAPFVPDLERVKRAGKLFEGSFKAAGNTLQLRWGFSSPSETADFSSIKGSCGIRPGQGLEVSGEKLALVAVREIPFRDRVRASLLAKETDAACHLLGIRFLKPDGGEVIFYGALATAFKVFTVIRVEDDKVQEVLAPTAGAGGNRMTMEFNRGRFSFQVGERTVWSGNEGGFTDVTVLVGASSLPRPGAPTRLSAALKEVALSGEVNPRWMAKKTAGLRDALSAELNKEFRAKKETLAAGEAELSVEAALREAAPAVLAAYKDAMEKMAAMRRSQLVVDLIAARTAMAQVGALDPAFAPAWYQQGALAEIAGDSRTAARHYEETLLQLPPFPEALCARGRLAALDGAWDKAADCVDRALALKPDFAELHLLRARILWEKREAAGALESTHLARRLAPFDEGLQSRAQKLANVARGPGWPRPSQAKTAHYLVRSDLSEAKCKLYGEHLEGIRPLYEEVLGRPLPDGKPADVLLFDSEEGYYSYMDFSGGDRLEHTLGAFSAWQGQMALFEGVDPSETLRVLSHEGFHQALHALAPDVPIWFNEGMAEYVGAARVEKGKILERGGILSGRLENLKLALKYGWVPESFDRIMLESQADFYDEQAAFKYAQAWSMIRYFLHGDEGRWKATLRDYVERLLAGDDATAAFQATFGKLDLRALEAGWQKHYGFVVKPRSAKPAAKAGPPPEPEPVDLMKFQPAPGLAAARWTFQNGVLQSTGNSQMLDCGYAPPEEYEWRLAMSRTFPDTSIGLGIRVGAGLSLIRIDDRMCGLELLDNRNLPNTSTKTFVPSLCGPGKTVMVVVQVRKSGVSASIDGTPVLDWKGELKQLTLWNGLGRPANPQNLFLWTAGPNLRVNSMTVKALPPTPETAPGVALGKFRSGFKAPLDPARSILLDADIQQWIVDEDAGQILALAPKEGQLLQVSIGEKKLLRSIPTGERPVALCFAAGTTKAVWVANEGSASLVKVDLEKGQVTETIPLSAGTPKAVVAVRKYLWWLEEHGSIQGLDLSDKRDLKQLGSETSSALLYDAKRDRLLSASGYHFIDFDASKVGLILRELTRKNLDPRTAGELAAGMAKATKVTETSALQDRLDSGRMLLDEKNGRLYVGKVGLKIDKLEAVLRAYTTSAHPMLSTGDNPYAGGNKTLEEIRAASADGKWVASGTHVFNAAGGAVHKELPLPCLLVAFSKDSKQLAYFDRANGAIVTIDVEPK